VLGVALWAAKAAQAAAPGDAAAAEALFEEGRALLEAGDAARACPKLAESHRLDPAPGALFALALCHEAEGRLATAWVEFKEVASRSYADHYPAREDAARKRAEAILPRLSYLTVRVDPRTAKLAGLTVLRNGVMLAPAAWSTGIPTDPGQFVISATAPGRLSWSTTVKIEGESERKVVDVPELVPIPAPARAPTTPRAKGFVLTPLRVAGIALGGTAVASFGLGAFSSVRALNEKAASNDDCTGNACGPDGTRDRLAAGEAADVATVAFIAGGALLGAGIALFVAGAPKDAPERRDLAIVVTPFDARVTATF